MSAIDEGIVREFFEQSGFFVRQVRKYQVQARKKTSGEEIDLLVYNPAWQRGSRPPDFFLFGSELKFIHRAIVAVKPWHTDVFSPAMLRSSPDKIFSFLEENVLRQAKRLFPPEIGEAGGGDVAKVLVLPALPITEPFRSQSVELLKARGVDAIISFRSMLTDIIESVETNRSYGKSDMLQVIRILKNYDLLKDPQLDLVGFGKSRPEAAGLGVKAKSKMIHPTAIVEPGARLGAGCEIHAYAVIRSGAILGDGVVVHPFAVVGGDPQDLKFVPGTPSGARIGAGTRIRENVTINCATQAGHFTEIGENCLLMAGCHVAHDCVVGREVIIANAVLLAGHVQVGDRAILGGGAGIHQFVRVGEGTMVAGGMRSTLDVPPFSLAAERDEVIGLNLVGLRRRGLSREAIADLKEAFHAVYFTPGRIGEIAGAILASGRCATPEARRFLEFFAQSKRGFARARRAGAGRGMRGRLAITCGDPAGVGPEVIAAWLAANPERARDAAVIGPARWLAGLPAAGEKIPVGLEDFAAEPGRPGGEGALVAWAALERAADGCRSGEFAGAVTGPVSKERLARIGWTFPGQTEFFAARWGGEPTMGFCGGRLCVALLTWHVPLREVSGYLTEGNFLRAVRAAGELAMIADRRPPSAKATAGESGRGPIQIGVCGLNPHAGEGGMIGTEERDIIDPILDGLRPRFPGLSRALPGDTLFARQLRGEFDVVLALYHDQGLAPLKAVDFDEAVNVTLGLPFVRTSPDHGTAFGLAGRGKASPRSFGNAVDTAWRLIEFRKTIKT